MRLLLRSAGQKNTVLCFFLGFAILFAATSSAGTYDGTYGEKYEDTYGSDLEKIFESLFVLNIETYKTKGFRLYSTPAPDFQSLKKASEKGLYKTYPEFVEHLKTTYPDFYQNSVMVVGSQSLQFSNLAHPRRIFYGGGKVLTLQTNSVEMMETSSGKNFEFNEILFSNQNGPTFHENPKACLACHGVHSRPIWEPYDFWPTALNSFSGFSSSEEETHWIQKNLASTTSEDSAMNGFTSYLYHLNLEKWAQSEMPIQLKKSGLLPFALGVLAHCDEDTFFAKNFLPPSVRSTFEADFLERKRYGNQALTSFQTLLDRTYRNVFGVSPNRRIFSEKGQRKILYYTNFGWALEQAGLQISDFILSHAGNEEIVFTPSSFGTDLIGELYLHRPHLFEGITLSKFYLSPEKKHFMIVPECSQLAKLSQESLKDFEPKDQRLNSLAQVSDRRPALSRCIKCHSLPDDLYSPDLKMAPYIPFDRPQELSFLLQSTSLGERILNRIHRRDEKQMPPKTPLTDTETDAMVELIQRLSSSH
ncbi:MAG TPA: hypothetical protein DCL41_10085 [Bdellovibrionales bacterium]|nr:hypothetical protein [Pseudobdellovibrionaceae bacterium]HAG92213.1 hypothetical protein [Bdellovibrionales bacterium]